AAVDATVSVTRTVSVPDTYRFTVESGGPPITHVRGEMATSADARRAPASVDAEAVRSRWVRRVDGAALYRECCERRYDYGPYYRCIETLWLGDDEALAALRLPEACGGTLPQHILHPALLDASFQTAAALAWRHPEGANRTLMPVAASGLEIHQPLVERVFVHVERLHEMRFRLSVLDEAGHVPVHSRQRFVRAPD